MEYNTDELAYFCIVRNVRPIVMEDISSVARYRWIRYLTFYEDSSAASERLPKKGVTICIVSRDGVVF